MRGFQDHYFTHRKESLWGGSSERGERRTVRSRKAGGAVLGSRLLINIGLRARARWIEKRTPAWKPALNVQNKTQKR